MTGDNKSKTYKERLGEFEKKLDEFTGEHGTKSVIFNEEIKEVLQLTRAGLEALDAEQCGIFGALTSIYAMYVQRQQNRNNVRKQYAERELGRIVASRFKNFKHDSYDKYELVRDRIVNADEDAKALYDIILYAEARVTELDFLSGKLSVLGKALMELQQTKRSIR